MATTRLVREAVKQIRDEERESLIALEKKHRDNAEFYRTQNKATVTISPMYAPYFGKTMVVTVNLVTVVVPCNGDPTTIPVMHATEVHRRMKAIDDRIVREQNMRSKSVEEQNPGAAIIV